MAQNPRIQACFNRLRSRQQKGLVGWVSAGDYGLDFSRRMLDSLAKAGCDVIELALPFSDPMADGSIIQASYERALRGRAGQNIPPVDLQAVLDLAAEFRQQHPDTVLLLYSYLNPILQMGFADFGARAVVAGVDGLIIVDMPFEESALRQPLANLPLEFVQLVAPTTPTARMANTLANHDGLVYAIAVAGVTGQKSADIDGLTDYVHQVRQHTAQPILVGFGIKTPEQAAAVAQTDADAVVVASAIIDCYHRALSAGKSQDQALDALSSLVNAIKTAMVQAATSTPGATPNVRQAV
ncbi:MAG: tryptophan synthase subunit alpha [Alphaproteobacteria bacterium]|nr:tryptophan synthase subunit alpha [Alphaproteobacteria bacterium]